MSDGNPSRAAFVHAIAAEIQAAIGAAPYASVDELIAIFSTVAAGLPEPETEVDRMVLRRLLAHVTAHVCEHAGAERPLRPIVDLVADAEDPREEFIAALAWLRGAASRRSTRT